MHCTHDNVKDHKDNEDDCDDNCTKIWVRVRRPILTYDFIH